MEDSGPRSLGRVKWFDVKRRHGVVSDVGGMSYVFELPDCAHDFGPGELVTFTVLDAGRPVQVTKMGSRPHTEVG